MDPILYEESRLKMQRTARTMGIIALVLVLAVSALSFLGFMLGAFALLLEFLSRNSKTGIEKVAFLTGGLAVVISLSLFCTKSYKFITDADYRHSQFEEISDAYSAVYGPEYAEYIESISNSIDERLGGQ